MPRAGIFFSIINGMYRIIEIFNNSEACKFMNPKLIQLLEPLIFFPITNVSSKSIKIPIIIPFEH